MDATTRFDTQIVGALTAITHYLNSISLGRIVDEVP